MDDNLEESFYVLRAPPPAPTAQPSVPPEALSWCIGSSSLDHWQHCGRILAKAHRVKEVVDQYGRAFHKPICGAQVSHLSDCCCIAPVGWPSCRHCARKLNAAGAIPAVYFEA